MGRERTAEVPIRPARMLSDNVALPQKRIDADTGNSGIKFAVQFCCSQDIGEEITALHCIGGIQIGIQIFQNAVFGKKRNIERVEGDEIGCYLSAQEIFLKLFDTGIPLLIGVVNGIIQNIDMIGITVAVERKHIGAFVIIQPGSGKGEVVLAVGSAVWIAGDGENLIIRRRSVEDSLALFSVLAVHQADDGAVLFDVQFPVHLNRHIEIEPVE